MGSRNYRRALIISVTLLLVFLYFPRSSVFSAVPKRLDSFKALVCPKSPLAEDVLVVVRTGATEAREKLPVHLRTTLKCVPDYVIYSDLDEVLEGNELHDVLGQVDDSFKNRVPEFKLYNQLQTGGREGLDYQTVFGSGPSGALDNPGWKLDKWKFLPMVDRALRHRPDARWFVFVEPDTYLVWKNMLEYLTKFESKFGMTEPHYIGKHMYIDGVLFAHGGSGFAISNPAMKKVTSYWREHLDEYNRFTEKQWAGDMILGKALLDVNIDMFWAYPHLQGDSVSMLDWNVSKIDREPWCYAPLTFHHMSQSEIHQMWQFEQTWYRQHQGPDLPRFGDVFKGIVYPQLRPRRDEWDNVSTGTEYSEDAFSKLSKEERDALTPTQRAAYSSFAKCQTACESRPSCLQFSYSPAKCSISDELRLGHAADSQCLEYSNAAGKCIKSGAIREKDDPEGGQKPLVQSGWLMDRIKEYVRKLDRSCLGLKGDGWVL